MSIGATIRQARHSAGLTLEELASLAGTSAPTLSSYERGRKEPRLATLTRILGAAGFDLVVDIRPRGPVPSAPMSRNDARSLALHRAVAARLVTAPDEVRVKARANLDRLRIVHDDGSVDSYLVEWAHLLDGPLDELVDVLVSSRPRARDLRHTSPFAGVLTEEERRRLLAASDP